MLPLRFLAVLLSPGASLVQDVTEGCREAREITFPEFVQLHGRDYVKGSDEYQLRWEAFEEAVFTVRMHNCAPEQEWMMSVNHLADRTTEELKALRSGYVHGAHPVAATMLDSEERKFGMRRRTGRDEPEPLPEEHSWGHLRAIKASTDQGACGSCWAVAAQTAMQAQSEIQGTGLAFDTNQLVRCTPNPEHCGGDGGCKGATAELAYEYALKFGVQEAGSKKFFKRIRNTFSGGKHGIDGRCHKQSANLLNNSVGVVKASGREVHYAATRAVATNNGKFFRYRGPQMGMQAWMKLAENREQPLLRALVDFGPVSVSVAAGDGWSFYDRGIMAASGCDRDNVIGHAVILYGYGVEGATNKKFYSIKNSWGNSWGEKGHVRLHRSDDEESQCGWDNKPELGSGCRGGPSKVWVCGTCGILYDTSMPIWGDADRL